MIASKITSLQHPIVKHSIKLKENRRYREQCGSAILTERKVILELSDACAFRSLIIPEGYSLPSSLRVEKIFLGSEAIFKKILGLDHSFPLIAEIALPPQRQLSGMERLLVLDGVADPGNLGTLLRTAEAVSWDAVFIMEGSADPFNDKALRAARGATFRLPIQCGKREELQDLIAHNGLHCYIADPQGQAFSSKKITPPLALILGNEGHGPGIIHGTSIAIPMKKETESLNVAIAGAILMHGLKNG